ncbi:MAG: hypothetical protein ACI857_001013 [Arenicella sp.]|jgi:hypothetical protein
MKYLLPLLVLALFSCQGETEKLQSDEEKIEISVRNYFFMGDSVEVQCTVADTISAKELDVILETTEENLRLIQLDIDTLNSMIDNMAYENLELDAQVYSRTEEISELFSDNRRESLCGLQLKMEQLKAKKMEFHNSNRLYMHLRRSTFANVSGYGVLLHYEMGDESADLQVLMNANFDVVD